MNSTIQKLFQKAWTKANQTKNTRQAQDIKNKIADCLHYTQELTDAEKTDERTAFFYHDLICIIQFVQSKKAINEKPDFTKTIVI